MRSLRIMGIALALVAVATGLAVAQTTPDPAMQDAREKTAVVFDLGRVFGFIRTMEEEDASLRLDPDQIRELYVIMTSIRQTERMEPDQADDWLMQIEDEILTVKQLMYVDQLYLARSRTAQSGSGTGTGNGAGGSATGESTGSIATYVAGGKFNPILDSSKSMGQDFAAYYEELGGRR